jgi:hypothetical protein
VLLSAPIVVPAPEPTSPVFIVALVFVATCEPFFQSCEPSAAVLLRTTL